jgi:hypothetical protein
MSSPLVAHLPRTLIVSVILLTLGQSLPNSVLAQPPNTRVGEAVPRDVREIYNKGLQYLDKTQSQDGGWVGGQAGPGVTGLGLMVFMASGEDPNFGQYSGNVRSAVRSLITEQNENTGYLGNSMYHHGFGMLGLAEAYGAVDDRRVWPDGTKGRTIGEALEEQLAGSMALFADRHRGRHVSQRRRAGRVAGRKERRD